MATQRQIDLTFDIAKPSENYKFMQRLGEKRSTDILVQVFNDGVPYNISAFTLGFEMRNDKEKIVIDKDQTRFTKVTPLQGVFSYRPPTQVQSFYGNAYLAYFTFESGGDRVTTERFRFYNDEDVQLAVAPELQEHYVSVIDDLIASNAAAMAEAQAIRDLINANGVVKKAGDTMTGDLTINGSNKGLSIKAGINSMYQALDGGGDYYMYSSNGKTPVKYITSSDTFNIQAANTNLIKKTGDLMSGDLNIVDNKGISFMDAVDPAKRKAYLSSGGNVTSLYDSLSSGRVWWYDHTSQTFTVDKNTNLVKKTGDSFTGSMNSDGSFTFRGAGGTFDMRPQVSGNLQKGFRQTVNAANGFYAIAPIDEAGTAQWSNQMRLDWADGKLTVNSLATAKDKTSTITPVTNVTHPDNARIPKTVRRGNTVTFSGAFAIGAGLVGSTIAQLEVDYRPAETFSKTVLCSDNTPVIITIYVGGAVDIAAAAKGKTIYLGETFVTN